MFEKIHENINENPLKLEVANNNIKPHCGETVSGPLTHCSMYDWSAVYFYEYYYIVVILITVLVSFLLLTY